MKRILAMLLVVIMCASIAACTTTTKDTASTDVSSPKSTAEPVKQKTLTIWVSNAFVSGDEQKKPQEEWYISKVCKKFEEENPGVKIEYTLMPDQVAAHQTFKASAMAETGPDIINLWSGQSIFALDDIILDISSYIPKEDKENIIGWDTVTLDFKEGGKVLGYPSCGHEVCGFLYNKKVLAEAGLDFDNNPPKNPAELIQALEKVKATGKQPIIATDGGWNGGYFTSFASWWVQANGSGRVASDSAGETKFVEDKAFIESFKLANEMYEKGLINKDYATIPNSEEVFYEGNTALLSTGNWSIDQAIKALGKENIGFYNLPDLNADVKIKDTCIGGPGQALVVAKYTKEPELAVKLISFINNKENHIALLKQQSKLPIRKDVTLEDLGRGGIPIYNKIFDLGGRYVFWADNSLVPDVNAEMQKLGALAITGKMSVEEMAQKLDQKAAETK